MVKYMEVGLKRSTACPCSILDKVLVALVEVDIGIGPSFIPPIIQVIMLDNLVFIVLVITEVDMGLATANFLHISMVD